VLPLEMMVPPWLLKVMPKDVSSAGPDDRMVLLRSITLPPALPSMPRNFLPTGERMTLFSMMTLRLKSLWIPVA
jgi:hypothetical protein